MNKAIFPGSFDPITKGHMDIIIRASKLVDTLYIGVGINQDKIQNQSIAVRLSSVKDAVAHLDNIKVITWEGLLVSAIRALDIKYIIRGIRNISDYEYEKNLLQVYKSQDIDIECIYILSDPSLAHVSSTTLVQLKKLGGDVKDYKV